MIDVKFLRFFSLKATHFITFIFMMDFLTSIGLMYPLWIITGQYDNYIMIVPLLFHLNSIYFAINLIAMMFFLFNQKTHSVLHRFYLWTRFLFYFMLIVGATILISNSLLYELKKSEQFAKHLFIIGGCVALIAYFTINIIWCIAIKQLIEI